MENSAAPVEHILQLAAEVRSFMLVHASPKARAEGRFHADSVLLKILSTAGSLAEVIGVMKDLSNECRASGRQIDTPKYIATVVDQRLRDRHARKGPGREPGALARSAAQR